MRKLFKFFFFIDQFNPNFRITGIQLESLNILTDFFELFNLSTTKQEMRFAQIFYQNTILIIDSCDQFDNFHQKLEILCIFE